MNFILKFIVILYFVSPAKCVAIQTNRMNKFYAVFAWNWDATKADKKGKINKNTSQQTVKNDDWSKANSEHTTKPIHTRKMNRGKQKFSICVPIKWLLLLKEKWILFFFICATFNLTHVYATYVSSDCCKKEQVFWFLRRVFA